MKITWFAAILTSGFINWMMVTMATSIGLLASKQKNSKINHVWSSESIKERLWCPFLFVLCTNLPPLCSEGLKWSEQPSRGGGYSGFQVTGMIEGFLWVFEGFLWVWNIQFRVFFGRKNFGMYFFGWVDLSRDFFWEFKQFEDLW